MRRVRVTIVAVEKQKVLHILSVSVALVIQHAKRMRPILLSSVACLAVPYFPHYLISGTIFGKRELLNRKCVCVLIISTTFVCNISHFKKISTWYYFCRILIKLGFSRQIFEKYRNIQFIENTSDGSRVVPCGQTTDGRTGMTNLIVAFRNFAYAPKYLFTLMYLVLLFRYLFRLGSVCCFMLPWCVGRTFGGADLGARGYQPKLQLLWPRL
jgi:hypothetical protein